MSKYLDYHIATNILEWPDFFGIVKLSAPRLFLKMSYTLTANASFEEWRTYLVDARWIDDAPPEDERDKIFKECWNFFIETEMEQMKIDALKENG